MNVGWAVVSSSNNIHVHTVSPTRRAAIVNWLVVNCQHMVLSTATDENIEDMWQITKGSSSVVQVSISVL